LEGKSDELISLLINKMERASNALQFEEAVIYRDQIVRIRSILEKHFIHGESGDVDIVACAMQGTLACVQVFFIRNGQQLGNKTFFPKINEQYEEASILQAFIAQYYLDKLTPLEILVSHELPEKELLSEMLSQRSTHQVAISSRLRGDRARWLQMAMTNAENSLQRQMADKQGLYERFLSLQELLGTDDLPRRLECFDISHTQGDQTVASCVVFDQNGPLKSDYRRFNIQGITPGDDYAAIAQAVSRRYQRMQKGEHIAPDILFR
jgi:excinuclease ABC subunit C